MTENEPNEAEIPQTEVEIVKPKTQMDTFLDESFEKPLVEPIVMPIVVPKYDKNRITKIELLGENAINDLFVMIKETTLSYAAMAKRLNEKYNPPEPITLSNVKHFLRTNLELINQVIDEQKSLNKVRSEIYMDHNEHCIKDVKLIDGEIEHVLNDNFLTAMERAKSVSDLLDKKRKLLETHARLSGNMKESVNSQVQVNIFQNINNEKSDIMNRLKKAEFKEGNNPNIKEEFKQKPVENPK